MKQVDPEALVALASWIEHDLAVMANLDQSLEKIFSGFEERNPEFTEVAGAGYLLHNLYCALENIFDQISRTFENHIVNAAQWHKELLEKMFLEMEGLRPALFPRTTAAFLHDLRSFRHVFRHAYEYNLDPRKLSLLISDWRKNRDTIVNAMREFSSHLRERAKSVEPS